MITLAYIEKLDFTIQKSYIAQKIDNLPLKTHSMASVRFLFQDILRKI